MVGAKPHPAILIIHEATIQRRLKPSDSKRLVRTAGPKTIPTRSSARTVERSCDPPSPRLRRATPPPTVVFRSVFFVLPQRNSRPRAGEHAGSLGDRRHAAASA